MKAFASRTLAAIALSFIAGCSSGQPMTYPVSGKVVFADGTPFTAGVVEFSSTDPASKGQNARGKIQPDGTFTLTTFRENDGAVAGEHRAIVVWSPPMEAFADEKKQPRSPIHPRFRDYEQSGLRFTVTKEKNEFTFTVAKP